MLAELSQGLLFNIILLLFSIGLLWKGADFLVDSASVIAGRFGISDLVIGLTVVAFGTSAPEFAVTVSASLKNQASISVGNIVGSNIFNTGFILGLVALIAGIKTSRNLVYRDGVFMLCISLLLLVFLHDLRLDFYEALVFIILLILYLLYLFIKREMPDEEIPHHKARIADYIILPLSIAAVIAGGHYLVDSSTFIARSAGLSEWIIGVTIVAMGTSSPEMATSIAAVMKGRHGMSAGNLIGSNIFNILGVLGIAGILRPLSLARESLTSIYILCIMAFVVLIFMRRNYRISRIEGALLLLLSLISYLIIFAKG